MGATGNATVDFGAAPGSTVATVTVTGQTSIVAGSDIEVWIQGTDTTADHNAAEHQLIPFVCRVTSVTAGTGFTISVFSNGYRLTGTFKARWVWN